jgi:L-lactate dehydrogenase complex protein LldG
MSEKENILGRVREALRTRAPLPGHHGGTASERESHNQAGPIRQAQRWLPPVGRTFEEQLSLFRRNALDLKADFRVLASPEDLPVELTALRDTEVWKKVGAHKGELTGMANRALGLPACHTDGPYDARDLESCDAGITECDALIAQTGSVLITSSSAGGRALSVLPPHHVVLARRDQLIPDLPSAFALLKEKYQSNYPSFISLITGPSRTGDIERILVLGAHGPKKLTIFFLP